MRYRNKVLGDHSGSVRADGWSYGIAGHFTKRGLLFCVYAHRDGKHFIVKADDLLTAFLSLERDAWRQTALTRTRRARTSPRRGPLNVGTKVKSVGARTCKTLSYNNSWNIMLDKLSRDP